MAKTHEYSFLLPLEFTETQPLKQGGSLRWVDAFKAGDWHDVRYGTTTINGEYLDSIIKNFNDNVRDIEIAVDYNHGEDKAKGDKAAGWIRAVRRVGDKVQTAIEFTEEALSEIKDKQWRYFSPKFVDEYVHSEGGQAYGPTMLMGSLTNTPVFKGMAPINFAEVLDADISLIPEDTVPVTPPAPAHVDNKEDTVDEAKLREMLGISDDADIDAAVKQLVEDGKAFSELRKKAEAAKTFAEQFPEQAKENEELRKRVARAEAKEFAESFTKPIKDEKGNQSKVLAPVVTEKIEEVYFNFSEGRGTASELKSVLDLVRTSGTVTLGEGGSGIVDGGEENTDKGELIREFAEKMGDVMRKESLEPFEAMQKVAEEHPDLYKAYIDREIPVK